MKREPFVAYMCMEFGLHEDFKIYSGGLGILAGDILKAAKDLNKPMVGIGMLWRQGYTCQHMDDNGYPFDSYYEYRYPFLIDTGKIVSVQIRGREVKIKIWLCEEYGNVPLYLLDVFLEENKDFLLTGQLYGWFEEERVAQEMILGIGGIRALEALGFDIDIYHFNDGHPVFGGLELIRNFMRSGKDFEDAYNEVRKKIVFTTHTPVIHGNETYDMRLIEYMGASDGFTSEQIELIGGNPFGLTVSGLRLSYRSNAVSKLHSETARKMWEHVNGASDIIAITNGVHAGTWQDEKISTLSGECLWNRHFKLKTDMLYVIERKTGIKFNPEILTIGFARRAAPYKRSNLIFKNKGILEKLLTDNKLQLIFSGKAHPNDIDGKNILADLFGEVKKYPKNMVFLEDYDIEIGKLLTRGCDVWLNNPIRPLEACGTSGMKAAMNGVLNVSVLDGWWPEGFVQGESGFEIGHGYSGEDCDIIDSESLYDVLRNEVVPIYYTERKRWLVMMENSIDMASKQFSASRMLEDYYEFMYI